MKGRKKKGSGFDAERVGAGRVKRDVVLYEVHVEVLLTKRREDCESTVTLLLIM